MNGLPYRHVDVFAHQQFSGNGLTVFPHAEGLSAQFMLRLTQELRQFESIFLTATAESGVFGARVFTVEEELPFAGHLSANRHKRGISEVDLARHSS